MKDKHKILIANLVILAACIYLGIATRHYGYTTLVYIITVFLFNCIIFMDSSTE